MSQADNLPASIERNRSKFPIVFINDSDETIPAFAIMQIVSIDGVKSNEARLVHVIKPNGSGLV